MKVGIVGHGSIGSRHAQNARILGHDVIVYDPAGPRDVKFERQIYEKADAVVIATPSIFHEGPLRAAIERGKHVLIEKPISTSLGMLDQLLTTAEDKGLVVMMGNNLRFHPCVQETKERLAEIGDSIWASFTCASLTEKKSYLSDGVTLGTGSHEVDLALYLFGPARVISSSGRWAENGSDEIVDFVLLHDNGVRSSFHLDFVTKNEIREFWIAGTEQNIGAVLPQRLFSLGDGVTRHKGSYDDDYFYEMSEFFARVEGSFSGPGASGRDGLETLKILLGVKVRAAFPA